MNFGDDQSILQKLRTRHYRKTEIRKKHQHRKTEPLARAFDETTGAMHQDLQHRSTAALASRETQIARIALQKLVTSLKSIKKKFFNKCKKGKYL